MIHPTCRLQSNPKTVTLSIFELDNNNKPGIMQESANDCLKLQIEAVYIEAARFLPSFSGGL